MAVLSISYTFPKPTAMEQLFKFSNKMGFFFGTRSALTFTRNERTIGKKWVSWWCEEFPMLLDNFEDSVCGSKQRLGAASQHETAGKMVPCM